MHDLLSIVLFVIIPLWIGYKLQGDNPSRGSMKGD